MHGWDHEQRAEVLARCRIEYDRFQADHHLIVHELETGRLTMDDHLDQTHFAREQNSCTREAFWQAMLDQSTPHPETLSLARRVDDRGEVRMFALNNESRELNLRCINTFHLDEFLPGFLSSCHLGFTKPMGTGKTCRSLAG